jgi:ankyrin repeat protein
MMKLIEQQSTVKKHHNFLSFTAGNCEKHARGKLEFLLSLQPPHLRTAYLNESDEYGQTALHDACEEGNLEAIEALLELGADVCVRDEDGKTAFDLAKPAARGVMLRHLAAWGKQSDLQGLGLNRALLESADAQGNTPLCHALLKGNLPTAKALLREGANADRQLRDGQSLLERACDLCDPEWIRLLLQYCRKPDLPAAMIRAIDSISMGQPGMRVLEALLGAGASPDALHADGRPLLEHACAMNQVSVARRLIELGADCNFRMKSGQTLQAWIEHRGRSERGWSEIFRLIEERHALRV